MKKQLTGTVLSRVVGSLLQAIAFVLLTRNAPLEAVGIIALASSVGASLLIATELGAGQVIARAAAQEDAITLRAASSWNGISSILLTLGGALVAVVISFANAFDGFAFFALAVSLVVERYIDVRLNFSIAQGRVLPTLTSVTSRRLCPLIILISLLLVNEPADIAYCYSVFVGATVGLVLVLVQVRLPTVRLTARRATISNFIRVGVHFSIGNLAAQSRTLDILILGIVAGPYQAGLLGVATRLISPMLLVSGASASVVLPLAARADALALDALLRRILYSFSAGSVLSIFGAILCKPVLVTLFKVSDHGAAWATVILVLSLPALLISSPLGAMLQALGAERSVAANGIAFAVVHLTLCAVLSFFFNAPGAAAASGITYLIKCFALLVLIRGARRKVSWSNE